MPNPASEPFFAVDVGNSRIKIGWFDGIAGAALPSAALDLGSNVLQDDDLLLAALEAWLAAPISGDDKSSAWDADRGDDKSSAWDDSSLPTAHRPLPTTARPLPTTPWWVGSVNWPLAARLSSAVTHLGAGAVHKLSHEDLPLEIRVESPERVGIDRLLAVVASNQLRSPDRPAIVIDLGTAITVDLVSADGAFEGGAILPGVAMAARAMAQQTDALPHSPVVELDRPPPPVGKSTLAAIDSGLYWGAIGAVRELIVQYALQLGHAEGAPSRTECRPELFLTGGAAPQVSEILSGDDQPARHIPHLVLSGIATTAEGIRRNDE